MLRSSAARRTLAPVLTAATAVAALVGGGPVATAAPATATAVPAGTPVAAGGVTVPTDSVLVVSVDGLNPDALRTLGPDGAPVLHRLVAEGTSTMNARTSVKRTETLPNHAGMLTGRNIDRRWGGHGVEHNDDRPGTVHDFAGRPVSSVYRELGRTGEGGALFASKAKFRLFQRSWPDAVDRFLVRSSNTRVVRAARRDLLAQRRPFRLVHLSAPDVVGHHHGFMGSAYLEAVRRTDRRIGRLVSAVAQHASLDGTTVVITADHGGKGRRGHAQAGRLANYRIPFVAWGAGVRPGTDLYALNPDRADPGTERAGWHGPQPVRNTEVANLVLDLLGLPAVRGSRADAAQDLDLR
jgi:hypothetical protein